MGSIKTLLGSVAAIAIAASHSTHAADIPAAPMMERVYSWTGCYVGIHGGGEVLYQHRGAVNGAGGLAGGQFGCNQQIGSMVFGLEAEGWWANAKSTNSSPSFEIAAKSTWGAAASFRAGVAADRTVAYLKAGAAIGGFEWLERVSAITDRAKEPLFGILLGAGVEQALGGNWTGKIEYNYIGFLAHGVNFDRIDPSFPFPTRFERTQSATAHIAKAGLNYRFGETLVAASLSDRSRGAYKAVTSAAYNWTGCYLGIQGGAGLLEFGNVFTFSSQGAGPLAGGQVGCNLQTSALVVGVEGEGWWSGIRFKTHSHVALPAYLVDSTSTRNDWDAVAAFRAGLAVDRAVIYVKVGAAWGRYGLRNEDDDGSVVTVGTGHWTSVGLLLGAGVEYALVGNLTGRLEYAYIGNLPKDPTFEFRQGNTLIGATTTTVSADKHLVKAGLNYKLGNPVAPAAPILSAAALPGPAHNWGGCHLGVHGGGGLLRTSSELTNGGGGLAGGQVGCDHQTGRFVIGIEAEGWWSGIDSSMLARSATTGTVFQSSTSRNRWDADVALRAGLAVERALFYVKAGAAVGRFDTTFESPGGNVSRRGETTLAGILLGTGIEYALAPQWSAKFEYNYLGYAARTVDFEGTNAVDSSYSATKHVAKFGINYLFAWERPVTARY